MKTNHEKCSQKADIFTIWSLTIFKAVMLPLTGAIGIGCVVGFAGFHSAKQKKYIAIIATPWEQARSTNQQDDSKGFKNRLGMKFVPVPGLRGIVFSKWETRVQDYTEFAKENPRINMEWRGSVKQGSDHPVRSVSWDDAVAFCDWLSKKDGRKYRLPTDHEWSMAIGVGDKENYGVYPWGDQWPPPSNYGNFDDERIEGYQDSFPFTAPVGSFQSNHHGIKDLSGNVWEWCQDRCSEQSGGPGHVLRGGSFYGDGGLKSLFRVGKRTSGRDTSVGFRCVCKV